MSTHSPANESSQHAYVSTPMSPVQMLDACQSDVVRHGRFIITATEIAHGTVWPERATNGAVSTTLPTSSIVGAALAMRCRAGRQNDNRATTILDTTPLV